MSAGALPQTPLGSLQRFPRPPSWISGAYSSKGKGEEKEDIRVRGGKERECEGKEGK